MASLSEPVTVTPCQAGSGSWDRAPHDGVLQALGTDELETGLLVHGASPLVDERITHPPPTGLVRVPLDHPATLRSDLIERAGQSHLGEAVLAVTLVDEDAGDAIVGRNVG